MKYLLLIVFLCAISSSKTNAQDESTINIHLFSDKSKDLKFAYKYVIDAEGENAVGKTVFENTIRITHILTSDDTLTFYIEADSTKISNPNTLEDGEASLLYAMIGLNMKLKCNTEGQLIEILNKDELLSEFKRGIQGMSNERKDDYVRDVLEENETFFFSKMYELNYALLLTHINKDFLVPFESKKDSLIVETLKTPKSTLEINKENIKLGDKFTFRTTETQKINEFNQNENGYVMINKPVVLNAELLLSTNISGLVQSLSLKTVIKREGMIMKRDGKIMNEMGPFTQYSNIEYVRME